MSGKQLSEQERRTWEEQKRTRDRVSNMIGQYLLKGCRMLGSSCGKCGVRGELEAERNGTHMTVHFKNFGTEKP